MVKAAPLIDPNEVKGSRSSYNGKQLHGFTTEDDNACIFLLFQTIMVPTLK